MKNKAKWVTEYAWKQFFLDSLTSITLNSSSVLVETVKVQKERMKVIEMPYQHEQNKKEKKKKKKTIVLITKDVFYWY